MSDLIKRDDAIKGKMAGTANVNAEFLMGMDERERRIFSIGYADGWNEHIDKCKYDIPSAEPKQGEWIERNNGHDTTCECSVCHRRDFIPNYQVGSEYVCMDRYWFERNYCPSCGARMKGADNE